MKVIQIMPEFGLGGAEIMCENLSEELIRRDTEVLVVSLFRYHSPITDRMEKLGIRIQYLNKKPGLDLSMFPKLFRLFRLEKPDVIHTHRYVMQYAIPAAVLAGVKKRVHTLHSIATKETTPKAQKLNYLFYHLAGVIPVALNGRVKDTVIERYKINEKKIPVVFNGIPLDRCIEKKGYAAGEVLRFLHIGRFTAAKNHSVFLRSFQDILSRGYKAHLTLVGTGELEEDIRKLIQMLKLTDSVTLYGTTNQVYPLLSAADVFILPSAYEGMPMTLIEAMATGLPILATNVGGIPDMLEDEIEAILTDNSEEAIADGMVRMFDPDLREKLGTKAKQRARREFASGKMAEGYINIYR